MVDSATLRRLLDDMRQPKPKENGKRLFADSLKETWLALDLAGESDLVSLEALLIEAIIHEAAPDDESSEQKVGAAKKRDVDLLALGLLDGYYHTKKNGTHYVASKRHKDYLAKSDYIAISYPNPNPDEDISIEDGSLPRWAISSEDRRCRENLSIYLSTKENIQKSLEEGLKNHVEEIEHKGGSIERKIKLPKPEYTLENFPPVIVEPKLDNSEIPKSPEKESMPSLPKEIEPSVETETNGIEEKVITNDDKGTSKSDKPGGTLSTKPLDKKLCIVVIIILVVLLLITVYYLYAFKADHDKTVAEYNKQKNTALKQENIDSMYFNGGLSDDNVIEYQKTSKTRLYYDENNGKWYEETIHTTSIIREVEMEGGECEDDES